MLSGKLNLYHNSDKNQLLKSYAWITSTIEDDKDKLESMFLPTEKEKNIRQSDRMRDGKRYRQNSILSQKVIYEMSTDYNAMISF